MMISEASLWVIILFLGGGLTILLSLELRNRCGCKKYKKPKVEAKTPEPEDLPPIKKGIVSGQRVGAIRRQLDESLHSTNKEQSK